MAVTLFICTKHFGKIPLTITENSTVLKFKLLIEKALNQHPGYAKSHYSSILAKYYIIPNEISEKHKNLSDTVTIEELKNYCLTTGSIDFLVIIPNDPACLKWSSLRPIFAGYIVQMCSLKPESMQDLWDQLFSLNLKQKIIFSIRSLLILYKKTFTDISHLKKPELHYIELKSSDDNRGLQEDTNQETIVSLTECPVSTRLNPRHLRRRNQINN